MSNRSDESMPAQQMKTNILRELFTRDLWSTGLAIVKYIPRSFRVPQVNGIKFFTEAKHEEFCNRVLAITPDNPRQWGNMSVAQMLHHLNLACGTPFGFYTLPDESYFTARTLFRWILIDWFPEQPVGLRLPKTFKIQQGATFDFDFEKQQLLKIIDKAWLATSPAEWGPHPMFGKMSPAEWGKLFQIHIDYHLKQFSA